MIEVIQSLGGVDSVTGSLSDACTDPELQTFLTSNVVYAAGRTPITVADVRAQKTYLDSRTGVAEANRQALANLQDIDLASIRGLREFIVAKFGNDPQLPPQVKTNDTKAATERAKIK